uniref:Putative conserved secreted protein n=1 Tax=Culex tarsalis TaxID=7177 RepID=A0A1Q3FTQ3_CULTA
MQKQNFSKLSLAVAATVALLLVSGVPTAQAGPIEDRPAVNTVQFRSLFDNSVCTGYQVFNNLFVTEARCLDTDNSAINAVYNLDFENEGLQSVEAFAMNPIDEKNVLFLKKDAEPHRRLVRAGRQDDEHSTAHPHTTAGAGFRDGNVSLMGATLLLLVGLITMKH